MSAVNPFDPPLAEVRDIPAHTTNARSKPKVWSRRGRVGRLRYLVYVTVGSLVCLLPAIGLGSLAELGIGNSAIALLSVLMMVSYVLLLVLVVFTLIQRSHDMGWSGWTVLPAFIPLVGLIWLFKPGTPGENRFGPPPIPNTIGVKIGAALSIVGGVLGLIAALVLPALRG